MTAAGPDVLIVGAGPTGLVTALGLAQRGIRCEIVDADRGIATGSRALGISRRTLQILDTLGVSAACLEKGVPWVGSRSYYRDQEVFYLELPEEPDEAFPAMLNLAQEDVVRILLEQIDKTVPDLVGIRWNTRLESLQVTADQVQVQLDTLDGPTKMTAPWLVACDGARSTVRERLGIRLEGESWNTRYVIVDVRLHSDHPAERRAWFDPPSNPGSTVLMHRQPDDVWRLDYQVDDEEVDADNLVSHVVTRVREHLDHIGETGPMEVVWTSTYRARALSAPTYRHGRALLSGDAAHLIPIFGIRGLNSAVEDANNLSWKIAAVIHDRASDALLDTYSTERRAAAHTNLALTTRATLLMSPPTRGYELLRRALLGLVAEGHDEFCPLLNPRQTGTVGHPDSVLHTPSGSSEVGPGIGDVYPDARVCTAEGERGYLSSHLGRRTTLVVFADVPMPMDVPFDVEVVTITQKTRSHLENRSGQVLVDAGNTYTRWKVQPGDVVLVRPDGHIAGAWRYPDATAVAAGIARLQRKEAP
ncbi:FAD-dependent oxidoreductase [Prauserella halophila]|uniref:FAD-dependent oxidoreductase n=1 Tax=Prauserella halophila TaxID=185641 RepID=A0ABP4GS03_9PSEU|nr:FAD-dependent monooxygenase [Prauserella halophila]MCP2235783.1 3-(3-hydroxy-phenyl)propionate hydroxylase [Prauserella halophila]